MVKKEISEDHYLPENHACPSVAERSWKKYAQMQKRRVPRRLIGGRARQIITWVFFIVILIVIFWEENLPTSQTESLPPYYYDTARDYVTANYTLVGEKNIRSLVAFLDQIKLREYEESVFDCSEASAMLEWLLEGAGFNASIASIGGSIFGHSWVLVTLDEGNVVAIEATSLTQNYYAPPGIVEAPDGRYREYTYEYREFLEWKRKYPPNLYVYDPNITFEEWKEKYLIKILPLGIPTPETYYNPPEIYASPEDAMKGCVLGSSRYVLPKSEWDWWNAYPYSTISPFSEWD